MYLQVKYKGKTPLNNEQTLMRDRSVKQVVLNGRHKGGD
jgi:hypothetical protein